MSSRIFKLAQSFLKRNKKKKKKSSSLKDDAKKEEIIKTKSKDND
jgi:hypothetical protein|tara:strand:+ start:171 stop:305 length:135 start_codon:yes stop_codon:yes gene_type:complete